MPKRTNDGIKKRCAHKRKTWNDCACPWWFGFYHGGREYRYSLTKLALVRGEKPPRAKDDAILWRDRLRSEIGAGTFVDPGDTPSPAAQIDVRLTFGDVCDEYLKRHVRTPTRRPGGRQMMEILIGVLRRAEIPAANAATVRLEQKPIDFVTKADVEAVRAWRRGELAAGKGSPRGKGRRSGYQSARLPPSPCVQLGNRRRVSHGHAVQTRTGDRRQNRPEHRKRPYTSPRCRWRTE
jgi:hypothetical protein